MPMTHITHPGNPSDVRIDLPRIVAQFLAGEEAGAGFSDSGRKSAPNTESPADMNMVDLDFDLVDVDFDTWFE